MGQTVKVLIVDDDNIVRRSFARFFSGYKGDIKFEVIEAENGQEAVEKAKKEQPDLVLLDINMPVMNGLRAAAEIKAVHPEYRVAMVTSSMSPKDLGEAKQANADLYITKGATRKEVVESLSAAIDVLILGKPLADGQSLIPYVREGLEAIFENRAW
jgi:DNA-binding NarL/FixJ family response regulator